MYFPNGKVFQRVEQCNLLRFSGISALATMYGSLVVIAFSFNFLRSMNKKNIPKVLNLFARLTPGKVPVVPVVIGVNNQSPRHV